jgi:hypothetical protein
VVHASATSDSDRQKEEFNQITTEKTGFGVESLTSPTKMMGCVC